MLRRNTFRSKNVVLIVMIIKTDVVGVGQVLGETRIWSTETIWSKQRKPHEDAPLS